MCSASSHIGSCNVILSLQTLPPHPNTESNWCWRMEWGCLQDYILQCCCNNIIVSTRCTCTSDRPQHMISLRTRPLVWGGHVPTFELSQDRMLTRPMTVTDGQRRQGKGFLKTFTCSLSLTARYGNSLGYALLLKTVWQSWGSNEQDSSDRMHSITANYPCIITVHEDNLNIGTYTQTPSSPNERSGLIV